MIVSKEVQHPVDEQSLHFSRKPVSRFRGLSLGRFPGDYNIAQQMRQYDRTVTFDLGKGKDISRAFNTPVLAVQGTDLLIISDKDAEFCVTPARVF